MKTLLPFLGFVARFSVPVPVAQRRRAFRPFRWGLPCCVVSVCLLLTPALHAELKLPANISDHMVLQRNLSNPIWGWDTPGTQVTVTFAGQLKTAKAGTDGKWVVKLDPVPANDHPEVLTITGTGKKEIQDVLVGEVWMCSGQSNMGFTLAGDWNGDIDAAASKLPNLRLIKVPQVGTQELQNDFKGAWHVSTADSARNFSAVGFYFGRYLHLIHGNPKDKMQVAAEIETHRTEVSGAIGRGSVPGTFKIVLQLLRAHLRDFNQAQIRQL